MDESEDEFAEDVRLRYANLGVRCDSIVTNARSSMVILMLYFASTGTSDQI